MSVADQNAVPEPRNCSGRAALARDGELELWRFALDDCTVTNVSCSAATSWTIRTAMLDPD